MIAPGEVRATAHARAGLLGNPSDGYGGKAIAFAFADFAATVAIRPAERFALRPAASDGVDFPTVRDAVEEYRGLGCEDGLRLLRAALVRFAGRTPELAGLADDDPRLRFEIGYETSIPRQVGLAGSSAIVVATLRALAVWFGVALSPFELAELALAVELEDLGIAAGAMDRVIQSYEGLLAMDLREPRRPGSYASLDPAALPPLFVAWDPRGGQPSGRAHGTLRRRWLDGDPEVLAAIGRFRALVDEGIEALARRDGDALRELMRRNFAERCAIFAVGDRDREMVAIAEAGGAAAKLCGSGGAVVGSPASAIDLDRLAADYERAGYRLLRPRLVAARYRPESGE